VAYSQVFLCLPIGFLIAIAIATILVGGILFCLAMPHKVLVTALQLWSLLHLL
jgi:hypothetical protein